MEKELPKSPRNMCLIGPLTLVLSPLEEFTSSWWQKWNAERTTHVGERHRWKQACCVRTYPTDELPSLLEVVANEVFFFFFLSATLGNGETQLRMLNLGVTQRCTSHSCSSGRLGNVLAFKRTINVVKCPSYIWGDSGYWREEKEEGGVREGGN